jgi:hypothetical protein
MGKNPTKNTNKIPACDRCVYYAHSRFLVCALYPLGPNGKSCQDFESAELWQPDRWQDFQDQGMEEFDWHPIFTGLCPDCDRPFSRFQLPPLQWQCPRCGWQDDTFNSEI